MIRLLFVGDGRRDAATNPHLVKTILGAEIEARTEAWARLHAAGRGFDRRLLFALKVARADGLHGVVATVDQDRSPGRERLRELVAARTKDREAAAPLPTALGCANPHAEAWLLDDPAAVRTVLRLDPETPIPNVRKVKSPKDALDSLHAGSSRADDPIQTVLVELAQGLDPARCQHAHETGFEQFAEDVRDEIGPLAKAH